MCSESDLYYFYGFSKRTLHVLSLRCVPKLHVSDFVAPRSHRQHNIRRTAFSLGTFGLRPTQSNAPAPLAGLQTGWTLWQATGAVDHVLPPLAVLCQRTLDVVVSRSVGGAPRHLFAPSPARFLALRLRVAGGGLLRFCLLLRVLSGGLPAQDSFTLAPARPREPRAAPCVASPREGAGVPGGREFRC